MKSLFSGIALMLTAGAADACPDAAAWGQRFNVSGPDLYTPRTVDVVAGGQHNLASCNLNAANWSGSMSGYVIGSPDFSITVDKLAGYDLEFRVDSACDSVLLVNTANGTWFYDDDNNGNSDAKVRLPATQIDGVYDVWIGTFDGGQCNARLTVETF